MGSVHFKTGRYSTHLPARLLAAYDAARRDKTLLELRDDIALLDTRVADVLKRVDSGESGGLWRALAKAWQEFRTYWLSGNTARMQEQLAVIGDLTTRGVADYAAWQEVGALLEQRRKLVESESKRLVDLRQVLTAEQAMTLVAVLVDSVRRHVTDRAALAAISTDLDRLLNAPEQKIQEAT